MSKTVVKKYTVSGINNEKATIVDSERQAIEWIKEQEDHEKFMVMPSYQSISSDQATFRATIVMPIWTDESGVRSDDRTAVVKAIRAIKSVIAQDINGWQLLCLGDGDAWFGEAVNSGWFKEMQAIASMNGNEIIGINTEHRGGYGFYQRELSKTLATGTWTMFLDSDDIFKPNHLSQRLEVAENSTEQYDLFYFNTQLPFWFRDAQLEYGKIGHSEVVIRTSIFKTLPPYIEAYGHDWNMIKSALDLNIKTRKVDAPNMKSATYWVRSTPDRKEAGFEEYL